MRLTVPCLALLLYAACGKEDEIRRYTVAREDIPVATTKAPALAYSIPENWKPLKAGGMRVAAFEVEDEGANALITVISLGSRAGGLLSNVNRWRGQVELGPTTEEDLREESKNLSVAGGEGIYLDLTGPEKRMLVVMTLHGGKTWFFKMLGGTEIVAKQKETFEIFTRSVRFE